MNITKQDIGELPREWAEVIAESCDRGHEFLSPYDAIREAWDYAPDVREQVEEALAAMIEAESNGK